MLGGGGGGVSHPSQLTTGLVIKSVTTSPTLAGDRMLFILQVSILSEQTISYINPDKENYKVSDSRACAYLGNQVFLEIFHCIVDFNQSAMETCCYNSRQNETLVCAPIRS